MSDATSTRSRENTRARLLDAAFAVFAEVGMDAASVEAVCDRAGFTRGAFYSNFASKDELFLELVSVVSERKLAAVTERVQSLSDGAGARHESAGDLVGQLVDVAMDSRQGVLLAGEMRTRAMRDPQLAAAYRAWMADMVGRVSELVTDLAAAYGLTLRMPAPDFACTMLELWQLAAADGIIGGLDDEQTAAMVRTRTQVLAAAVVEGLTA